MFKETVHNFGKSDGDNILVKKCLFSLDAYILAFISNSIKIFWKDSSFDPMITLIFTISGDYFGMIDQDANGEIDEQEATFAINFIFGEPVEPMPEV